MTKKIKKLIFCAIIAGTICNGEQNKDNAGNVSIYSKYAELHIDRSTEDSAVPGDWDPYLGPASIDIDPNGFIYLANMNNTIHKYNTTGKRIWSVEHNTQQLDIKVFEGLLYSFDGKNIYKHTLESGIILDTIKIEIGKNDYTPVGNVSKFYGKYLFINKWRLKSNKELLYVYDLQKDLISSRVPTDIEIYPVTKCSACSLTFIKKIFTSKEEQFVSESEAFIAYFDSKSGEICIFDKNSGLERRFTDIPPMLSTMSIRFVSFLNKSSFICCTIRIENFEPKKLIFYKVNMDYLR